MWGWWIFWLSWLVWSMLCIGMLALSRHARTKAEELKAAARKNYQDADDLLLRAKLVHERAYESRLRVEQELNRWLSLEDKARRETEGHENCDCPTCEIVRVAEMLVE
jgi:hypothetical protein